MVKDQLLLMLSKYKPVWWIKLPLVKMVRKHLYLNTGWGRYLRRIQSNRLCYLEDSGKAVLSSMLYT